MSLDTFLSRVNTLQILSHYLFENNFYYYPSHLHLLLPSNFFRQFPN
jgi:hypothetical protein